jgi:hypothetical protein
MQFSDDRTGTLTWPGGTIPIVRYDFQHGDDAAFQPTTGWWWNPDQSGRGFSIEQQGDHMFIGAYMYDESGRAVWYVADALMQSPTTFRGPLLRFANGQTMGGAYRAPSAPATAGTITVQFTNPDEATVTLSDLPPSGLAAPKSMTSFPIQPQSMMVPALNMPTSFSGTFLQHQTFDNGAVFVITGSMTLVETELTPLRGIRDYELSIGNAKIQVSGNIPGDPPCTVDITVNRDMFPAEARLTMKPSGKFSGRVHFTPSFSGSACVDQQIPLYTYVFFPMVGTLRAGDATMDGYLVETGRSPSITSSWHLTPQR